MAEEEKDDKVDDGLSEIDRLENAVKTNRLLFFVSFVLVVLVAGFLVVSDMSIKKELLLRREVSSEELSKKFTKMESYFEHLSELNESQAKMYLTFDESLLSIRELYTDEKTNRLKQLMIEREKDHQALLDLMANGIVNLGVMTRAGGKEMKSFEQKVQDAKKVSKEREAVIKSSMKPN